MKKPFETEMDDTRQAVGQIVGLCTTIALHQEFGVGKTRLERIKARIDELENQNTEVIMTPDAYGRPSKDKAETIRESWLAFFRLPNPDGETASWTQRAAVPHCWRQGCQNCLAGLRQGGY